MSVRIDATPAIGDGTGLQAAGVQPVGGARRGASAADTQAADTQAAELGLSAVEKRILTALSRRPLGLYPAASVAIAAGAGHEETVSALARLVGLGLITGDHELVLARPVRREVVWRLDVVAAWNRVPDVLRMTPLPEAAPQPMPDHLPARFAHLFWWGDTSLYELPRDAAFVAEQILASSDVTSWGWALYTLPCDALEWVAERPHLAEDRRQLINCALAERRASLD